MANPLDEQDILREALLQSGGYRQDLEPEGNPPRGRAGFIGINAPEVFAASAARLQKEMEDAEARQPSPYAPDTSGPQYGPELPPPAAPVIDKEAGTSAVEQAVEKRAQSPAAPPSAAEALQALKAVPAATPSPEDKLKTLFSAIQGRRQEAEPRLDLSKANMAAYYAGIGKQLPPEFFAKEPDPQDVQAARDLKQAQIAHALMGVYAAKKGMAAQEGPMSLAELKALGLSDEEIKAIESLPRSQADKQIKNMLSSGRLAETKRAHAEGERYRAENLARLSDQYERNLALKIKNFDKSTFDTAFKEISKEADDQAKSGMPTLKTALTRLDALTDGMISQGAAAVPENFRNAQDLINTLDAKTKRVSSGLYHFFNDTYESLKNKFLGQGLSERDASIAANKELSKDEKYSSVLQQIDVSVATTKAILATQLMGKAITGREADIANAMLGDELGASPMRKMIALQLAAKAIQKTLEGSQKHYTSTYTQQRSPERYELFKNYSGLVRFDDPVFGGGAREAPPVAGGETTTVTEPTEEQLGAMGAPGAPPQTIKVKPKTPGQILSQKKTQLDPTKTYFVKTLVGGRPKKISGDEWNPDKYTDPIEVP